MSLQAHRSAHRWLLFATLAALALASLALSLAVGSVSLTVSEIWRALSGAGEGLEAAVVLELRLPRALSAFVTGGLLALAGALMQVLLRNPLADPYVLGVSGGAAVAALLVIMTGAGGAWLSAGAFSGAMLSMLLVFALARGRGSWTTTRLLLTGVVLASGWSAIISFLLTIGPEQSLRGMLFWLMGDLSEARRPTAAAAALAVGLLLAMALARSLNLLARGEIEAGMLGVAVGRLRLILFFLASLLTASAVTIAGSIGFVGLVVPHLLRLIIGSDHRLLLPASVLLGGSFLVLADTLARSLIAPQQLPVGVLSAFIGVPVFLYLLRRSGSGA